MLYVSSRAASNINVLPPSVVAATAREGLRTSTVKPFIPEFHVQYCVCHPARAPRESGETYRRHRSSIRRLWSE